MNRPSRSRRSGRHVVATPELDEPELVESTLTEPNPAERRVTERGMVTAEVAFASLAAAVVLTLIAGVLNVGVVQLRLGDLAAETARQAARGDRDAVERARRGGPEDAVVTIREQGGQVHVRAELTQRLAFGQIDLHADAWVLAE